MVELLRKVTDRGTSRLAVWTGRARRRFARQTGRLRVLGYHGLIADELAERAWVPPHFVRVSAFRRQMQILSRLGEGTVRPLCEAVSGLAVGDPGSGPAVSITFDDGTADNVTLALPVLRELGLSATFFLTTGPIDRGELLVNDRLRLLCAAGVEDMLEGDDTSRRVLREPAYRKTLSVAELREIVDAWWARFRDHVDPAGVEALRMMTWAEAARLRDAGMEIGAHTVNHAILSREDAATREKEIRGSVDRVREQLGIEDVPFAYPNGQAGDYESTDGDVLAGAGAVCAVTTREGWNDAGTDRFALYRSCIGLHDSDDAFLAKVYGMSDAADANGLRVSV